MQWKQYNLWGGLDILLIKIKYVKKKVKKVFKFKINKFVLNKYLNTLHTVYCNFFSFIFYYKLNILM